MAVETQVGSLPNHLTPLWWQRSVKECRSVRVKTMGEVNTAEEKINAVSGAAGQVKQSQGAGLPPLWGTVAVDYPMKLKPAISRIVIPGWYFRIAVANPKGAGKIYYTPIFV